MSEFKQYRRKQIAELRPVTGADFISIRPGGLISISAEDSKAGSPKAGDMVARNPKNHADQWLVAAQYFVDNFEPVQVTNGDCPVPLSLRQPTEDTHDKRAYWKSQGYTDAQINREYALAALGGIAFFGCIFGILWFGTWMEWWK